jgi:hypothetical protein
MTAPARFAHAWKIQKDRTTIDFKDNRLLQQVDR